ncbi:HET-domain-containing protein, partial [Lepidopterella palustris CBS 459.81]
WVALSYCWGGEPSLKLTKLTIRTLTQGIPLDRFEATIRDAILVTRGLGITYLWVDALCIFQDEDSSDWNEQSSKMSEIYGGSTVTIVAADSSSVTEGFLQQRELQYIAMDWLPSTMFSDKSQLNTDTRHVYLSPSWNPDKDKMVGPWSKRGWTMQEGLLPNRLLFYTSYQMAWKCRTVIKYERGAACEPSAEVIRGESISERYRLWYELVEDYTPRHFKYIQDRLIAISGLAKIFGDLISDQYFAGLWKRDMVRGLVWHASGAKLIPNNSTDNPSFHVNTAPSWSWASVGSNVAVVNDHADQDGFRALAKIEDVEVELVNPSNPFGAANAGSVIITGPLARLS